MNKKSRQTIYPFRLLEVVLLSITILKTSEMAAHAYIDPGTGSMLLQLVSGVLLAGLITIKRWSRFVAALFKKKPKDENEQGE